MRFYIERLDGKTQTKTVANVVISSEEHAYRFNSPGFTHLDGFNFTTKDQDHDTFKYNCARYLYGGWWYRSCSNLVLNGAQKVGTKWEKFLTMHERSKATDMMLRCLCTTD